jgi:hydroxymethylbilane synthase
MWQADHVAERLRAAFPGLTVRLEPIKTTGDRILDVPLAKVGGKALFVKEIEEALLGRRVDLAVHSIKDLPVDLPPGLHIAAVPAREDPRDVLISAGGRSLEQLPRCARVGTSSLRRRAQLLYRRPDLEIVSLRGNVDTRIRKLDAEGLDGVVLAAAGVRRMGMAHRITQVFSPQEFDPAIGQGALGIETRQDDEASNELAAVLEEPMARACVEAEREFLRVLQGGCQVPVGALARVERGVLVLQGMVAGLDGEPMLREGTSGSPDASRQLGAQLGRRLLELGARAVLEALDGRTRGGLTPP